MELLEVFIFIIGFVVGYIYREITLIRQIAEHAIKIAGLENAKSEGQSDQLEISDIKKLTYEVIDNVNYFYCEESGNFVGQGSSFEQAATQCSKTLGINVMGVFSSADDKKNYCFVDGKCCEYVTD
jgi:hypothetical protein